MWHVKGSPTWRLAAPPTCLFSRVSLSYHYLCNEGRIPMLQALLAFYTGRIWMLNSVPSRGWTSLTSELFLRSSRPGCCVFIIKWFHLRLCRAWVFWAGCLCQTWYWPVKFLLLWTDALVSWQSLFWRGLFFSPQPWSDSMPQQTCSKAWRSSR